MKLLVCVKQVPDTTEISIDPATGNLIRAGVPSILNPYDRYALEMALRLRDARGAGSITVLSMGPRQAEAVLRDCLALGADRGVLLCDPALGGADTLATSYALACAVSHLAQEDGPFDLVLCGKQAIDGDTAQVGPELAEHLGLPQVTNALEARLEDGALVAVRDNGGSQERVAAPLPCLVTVTKPFYDLRQPSLKGKLAAKKADIPVLTADLLGLDRTRVGLKGSPTRVARSYVPALKKGAVLLHPQSDLEAARQLLELLRGRGVTS